MIDQIGHAYVVDNGKACRGGRIVVDFKDGMIGGDQRPQRGRPGLCRLQQCAGAPPAPHAARFSADPMGIAAVRPGRPAPGLHHPRRGLRDHRGLLALVQPVRPCSSLIVPPQLPNNNADQSPRRPPRWSRRAWRDHRAGPVNGAVEDDPMKSIRSDGQLQPQRPGFGGSNRRTNGRTSTNCIPARRAAVPRRGQRAAWCMKKWSSAPPACRRLLAWRTPLPFPSPPPRVRRHAERRRGGPTGLAPRPSRPCDARMA